MDYYNIREYIENNKTIKEIDVSPRKKLILSLTAINIVSVPKWRLI